MYRGIPENHDPGVQGGMLADTNKIDWVELGEGVKFKMLRYCNSSTSRSQCMLSSSAFVAQLPHYGLNVLFIKVSKGEASFK